MIPREIKKDIYWTGFIDWDRRLFDSLIPTPHGTTYNSYLVKGSGTGDLSGSLMVLSAYFFL